MNKIQDWIQARIESLRAWLHWKNLALKDLLMFVLSFVWLVSLIIFAGLIIMSCGEPLNDTGEHAAVDDGFVNRWWSLETDNILLNQVVSEDSCYKFYEFSSDRYGDWRKLYAIDSVEEGSYFVADWERTGTNSIVVSEKYELVYERSFDEECYSLLAYSSLMNATGEACPCE